jgi:ligand-binding sensor domain-containing protein
LLAALLTLVPGVARADWQNYHAAQDGLADNQVLAILEAADGTLWFGTPGGASHFDGTRWTTTRDSLPNLAVVALAQERSGAMWFGTQNGGASRFDGTSWTHLMSPGVLPSNQVEAILEDHAGDLWFGTPAGLARYEPGPARWTTYLPGNSGLVHPNAWRLVESHDHALWIATPRGVSRLDSTRTTWTSWTATPGALERDSVLALAEDRRGAMWFGTDQGVFRYAGGAWQRYRTADGLPSDPVMAIAATSDSAVWFGGFTGLSRFDGRVWRTQTATPDGVSLGQILALLQDTPGALWVATAGRALFRDDRTAWRDYFSTDPTCPARTSPIAPYAYVLGSNCVSALLETARGELWFATSGGGASRYGTDGRWSTILRGAGRPLPDTLASAFEDRFGRLWFGGLGGGVASLDSARVAWSAITRADGIASDTIYTVFEDRRGDLWLGTATGASRWNGVAWSNSLTGVDVFGNPIAVHGFAEDGTERLWCRASDGLHRMDASRTSWTTIDASFGLPGTEVRCLVSGLAGRIWVGTDQGLAEFDGNALLVTTDFGGGADRAVNAVLEEPSGGVWAGLDAGAAHVPNAGGSWTHYPATVLGSAPVTGILDDDLGTTWLATFSGLARFNGESWRTYDSRGVGLASDQVTSLAEDRAGHLWFGTNGGLTEHEPDRVAPQTVFLSGPPALTPSQNANIVFGAAYGEAADLEFATRWDGGSVSPWSTDVSWIMSGIPDGVHHLRVVSRDWTHNTDPTPAVYPFEVDATPPAALIESPVFGQPVRGRIEIRGRAADARFRSWRLDVRPTGTSDWSGPGVVPIDSSRTPIADGTLSHWDTDTAAEGDWDVRLAVVDSLGLVGAYPVTVIVDNHPPYADVTAPARVSAVNGGDVYTTLSEVHLYFPPHAFSDDAIVSIAGLDMASGPGTPPGPALSRAYDIAWSAPILKPGTLEMKQAGAASAGATPTLYRWQTGTWSRVGGTVDGAANAVSAPLGTPGRYALFSAPVDPGGAGGLTALSLTPRVFSPTGGFASASVGIAFTLPRPAATTVRVFNRAGRPIREILSGATLPAGANLVRWDGRDGAGAPVLEGIYLVGVEALGETHTSTVAVVR